MNDNALDPRDDIRLTDREALLAIKGMIELLKTGNINMRTCLTVIELFADVAIMTEPEDGTI